MDNEKLKKWVAPDAETRSQRLETFKQYAFYGIIALILIIVLFIVPVIAGGVNAKDFGYYLPKSKMGWIVFWAIRGGTVAGNMCVYGLFKAQAKVNAKDNPKYIEANELLAKQNGKRGFIPRSPTQKATKDWTSKGILVFLTTAAESIVIGMLAINWDLMTFLSCITSSVTAVLFGVVQMIKDEVYWTEEYLLYAKYKAEQLEAEKASATEITKEKKEDGDCLQQQGVQESPTTSPEECTRHRDIEGETKS